MNAAIDARARVAEATAFLGARLPLVPTTAIVLGSGLGAFASRLTSPISIPYADIPHWPPSAVVGHEGRLVAGHSACRPVLVLSGRTHVYEGRDLDEVTFGIRVAGRLGVRRVILTNAAGGIHQRLATGVVMVIDDHINFTGRNPLVGPNWDTDGPRFPDMSAVYSPALRATAAEVATARHIPIDHGVYLAVTGPSYETPAEIRAFRALGADAVGMSTVAEAIVARHMGLDVLGLSVITNAAAGLSDAAITAGEVLDTTARVSGEFMALLEGILERLPD